MIWIFLLLHLGPLTFIIVLLEGEWKKRGMGRLHHKGTKRWSTIFGGLFKRPYVNLWKNQPETWANLKGALKSTNRRIELDSRTFKERFQLNCMEVPPTFGWFFTSAFSNSDYLHILQHLLDGYLRCMVSRVMPLSLSTEASPLLATFRDLNLKSGRWRASGVDDIALRWGGPWQHGRPPWLV